MKRLTMLLFIIAVSLVAFGQGAEAKRMLKEIEGKYSLDDNGNVSYVRVIEVQELKAETIFQRAESYFIYNYGSGKSVIQTQDKEKGLIIAKGLYDEVHLGVSLTTTYVDTWHIVRVDIKDGKARVILTLTEYETKVIGGNTPPKYNTYKVTSEYPFNENSFFKTVMAKSFYKSHMRAMATLDAIEKAIKEGSTSKSIENSTW